MLEMFKVQGFLNTFGDLCGTIAALERINSLLSLTDSDDSLAYGCEGFSEENFAFNKHFMSALKSAASKGCSVEWPGNIFLEGYQFDGGKSKKQNKISAPQSNDYAHLKLLIKELGGLCGAALGFIVSEAITNTWYCNDSRLFGKSY
ncbi:hypothetical protein IFM89_004097 [Coptis chinensis]|uniref:Uncharacterized protein n=1 Tax=Coptis chinensis TaxID=261450 RepID=A0A835IWV2_9MAGN|nr:hypothetical protein IFM89_004097 [Coptis chinensis]